MKPDRVDEREIKQERYEGQGRRNFETNRYSGRASRGDDRREDRRDRRDNSDSRRRDSDRGRDTDRGRDRDPDRSRSSRRCRCRG